METIQNTPSIGDEKLDKLLKFASRLRDNGVTTFEITWDDVTFKVMQNPLPLSLDEQKKQEERDLFGAG